MDIRQKKDKLRKAFMERRAGIAGADYRAWSGRIEKRLKEQPEFRQAHTVHCYVSINERREVDTHSLIGEMLRIQKQVVVPVVLASEGALKHVKLHSLDDLEPNEWGVSEPRSGEQVPVETLDLVIVPMVAADERRNRLGYGKGYYDRFLKEIGCPALGLAFEECVTGDLPTESFDMPLTKVITEERVI